VARQARVPQGSRQGGQVVQTSLMPRLRIRDQVRWGKQRRMRYKEPARSVVYETRGGAERGGANVAKPARR